ncbi:MAG: DsrE family protein [Verrucomicrobia bacterium]|nr:MAG: DsrE family protein [Verrucomicrobiota bacterium]
MSDAKPRVLILVTSDPRKSHRPSEAVRIAAGVAAWKKVDVRIYLHGSAIRVAGEWVDELIGEDDFVRYLPIAVSADSPVLVQAGARELAELGDSPVAILPIDDAELARFCARSTNVLRF